jgi:hypothetical protein
MEGVGLPSLSDAIREARLAEMVAEIVLWEGRIDGRKLEIA